MFPSWSPQARIMWGKTNDEARWLPLVQHLEDCCAVMGALWDLQPQNIRTSLTSSFGSEESARAFATFCAGVHDVGKASNDFAWKARTPRSSGVSTAFLCDQIEGHGFVIREPARAVPHGALGQVHVEKWLTDRVEAPSLPRTRRRRHAIRLAGIIGGHHGVNPTDADLESARTALEGEIGPWSDVRDEILDTMAHHTGADRFLATWVEQGIPVTAQVLVEGLVIVADWISSSEYLFPYDTTTSSTMDRLDAAWRRLSWPHPWQPTASFGDDDLFAHRFPEIPGGSPNAMQRAAIAAASQMPVPGLCLIEAPMGQGKTEAALLAAEVLARRFGLGGIFIGLPTMATSNAMFARIRHWLDHVDSPTTASISLAHSKSGLNEDFRALLPWNQPMDVHDDTVDSRREASALVHSWFLGRKRAILANHVVGTIDQALFAGLRSKHVVLRHLGLASKVVIIDEVHAADEYMRTYLCRVLSWLGAYRTPVILMSATLPPQQRRQLMDAYAQGAGVTIRSDEETGTDHYPVLTTVSGSVRVIEPEPVHESSTEVSISALADDDDTLSALVTDSLQDGGCLGIIRNTVARAQRTYDLLRDLPDCEVVLLHSRFLAPHRADREADLVRRLSRSGEGRPHRMVVVGTQVLEQSLDIDLDVLVTDIAPMDLVLQRIGRLHRHQRSRPPRLEHPTCFLTGVLRWQPGPPEFDAGVLAVYQADPLLRCAATLERTDGVIRLPGDIPTLVTQAYAPDIVPPSGWKAAMVKAAAVAQEQHAETVSSAQGFLLADPRTSTSLGKGFTDVTSGDPEASHSLAKVRDSEDSLEVVVVHRGQDGTLRLPTGIGHFSGAGLPIFGPPDDDVARAAASCTVSLPRVLTGPWNIDRVIAELENSPADLSGWQASPWLRGQLALVLDDQGRGCLAGHPLHYDHDHGLVVEPAPKEADAT